MPTLGEIRQQFPVYKDWSDDDIIKGMQKKYPDRSREEILDKLGLWDPHREEQFDVGMGQILPSVGRAAKAMPASAGRFAGQLWDLISNPGEVIENVKQLGFEGVAKSIGNDLVEHYGSLEKARRTFETDPFRFVLDLSLPLTGGGSALAKLPGITSKLGEAAGTLGRAIDPVAMAGRTTQAAARGIAAPVLGKTTGAGTQAMREAELAGYTKSPMPAATQPLSRVSTGTGIGAGVLDYLTGGHAAHLAAKHPFLAGGLVAGTSPRAMGAAMYGLGAAERYGEKGLGAAARAATLPMSRKDIQTKAQEALRDPDFKKNASSADRKTVRAATKEDALSTTLTAAQRVLQTFEALNRPRITVRPTIQSDVGQGRGYGGTEGGPTGPGAQATAVAQPGQPTPAQRVYDVHAAFHPTESGEAIATPSDKTMAQVILSTLPPSAGAAGATAGFRAAGMLGTPSLPPSPGEASQPKSQAASSAMPPMLSEVPPIETSQLPEPRSGRGETPAEFMWQQLLKGGDVLKRARSESFKAAMGEEFDPSAPLKVASYGMSGAVPFAQAGALGAAGGRMKVFDPSGIRGLSEHLTPEELLTVTKRNVDNLVSTFKQMPSAEEMAAVAYSGRAKRGWYKQSAKALIDTFGNDDAPRFASLLAALSPQTSVQSNTENALRTWLNWTKAGRPTDEKSIRKILAGSVQGEKGEESVLEAWIGNSIRALQADDPTKVRLSGPKVNSFMLNLRNHVHEVTNDAWMSRYARVLQQKFASAYRKDPEYGGETGFKSPGYLAMSAATRRAAKFLSEATGDKWTPAEIQETIWSWAKTLHEKAYGGPGKKGIPGATVEKLLKAGNITHEEIADTPDFALLFTRGIYRNILEQAGYGDTIKRIEAELGGAGAGGRALPGGTPTRPEGGAFAPGTFERHLQRAGRRLDRPLEE